MEISPSHFHQRLSEACLKKDSYLCVGIDPRKAWLPKPWAAPTSDSADIAKQYLGFGKAIIDAVHQDVPAIKPQSAFFEVLGHQGIKALEDLCVYARSKDLLIIGDVKRGDIGTTAAAYAQAGFRIMPETEKPLFDAVTVNPYLGRDGVQPFIDEAIKVKGGIFVLCKTSNPSSLDLQDLKLAQGENLHQHVAKLISAWGKDHFGLVGAVVGATHPHELKELRTKLPSSWILIPGVGAQGGSYKEAMNGFESTKGMALISASRSITYPWSSTHEAAPTNWQELIKLAAKEANDEIRKARNDVR